MLLTSHIPLAGLGIVLAVFGGLVHIVLIVSNQHPNWWKVGLVLAVIPSLISIVGSTLARDRFPLAFIFFLFSDYFLLETLIFIFIQNYCVIAMLKK